MPDLSNILWIDRAEVDGAVDGSAQNLFPFQTKSNIFAKPNLGLDNCGRVSRSHNVESPRITLFKKNIKKLTLFLRFFTNLVVVYCSTSN